MLVMQLSAGQCPWVLPCDTTRRGTGPEAAVAAAPPGTDDVAGIDELADVVNDGDGIDSVVEKPPNSGVAHAGSRHRHSSSASYFFFKAFLRALLLRTWRVALDPRGHLSKIAHKIVATAADAQHVHGLAHVSRFDDRFELLHEILHVAHGDLDGQVQGARQYR